mmetsp:Transcript_42874/g.110558  ORF Transcript_42874/g.110558 Transcript_42874/m.110558 type:complete len:243 (-) Transcript_42874:4088-4816(-)
MTTCLCKLQGIPCVETVDTESKTTHTCLNCELGEPCTQTNCSYGSDPGFSCKRRWRRKVATGANPKEKRKDGKKRKERDGGESFFFHSTQHPCLRKRKDVSCSQKGWSLIATKAIPAGTLLLPYKGEVCDMRQFQKEEAVFETQNLSVYLGNHLFLRPFSSRRCLASYINHSCDPNCVLKRWTEKMDTVGRRSTSSRNEKYMLFVQTLRAVKPQEEITFSYNSEGTFRIQCSCGSSHCRGWI